MAGHRGTCITRERRWSGESGLGAEPVGRSCMRTERAQYMLALTILLDMCEGSLYGARRTVSLNVSPIRNDGMHVSPELAG